MSDIDEIEKKALLLPMNERARLAAHLIRSLDDAAYEEDVDTAWGEEIERRYADYRKGKKTARPVDEAMREIQSRFE